jgi:hypothetical protein
MPWHSESALQLIFGAVGVAITASAYAVMIWKIVTGKARPHPVAWYGFGALTAVGFFVQWQKGAGAGSWVLGLTFVACFVVGAFSQWKGHWHVRDFDGWDWLALALGLGCGVLYASSRNLAFGPLASAIWATTGDLILYAPIYKNSWSRPDDENATGYFLNSLKFLPSFAAMNVWSWETCLYPAALVIMNGVVVLYLNWRRWQRPDPYKEKFKAV